MTGSLRPLRPAEGTGRAPELGSVESVLSTIKARSHATLSESVASDLQALILRGELKPGERLPTEAELGDALGVSRSVIRDAIRMLAARGLLDVRQGHGTEVAVPTPGAYADAIVALLMRSNLTMGDVISARAALETELMPLVAQRGTPENWDTMERHLTNFAQAVSDGDWPAAHDAHMLFHLVPFHALRMPALELMLTPLQQCVLITSLPPTRAEDQAQWEVELHPPIIEALRAGDGEAARAAMDAHFEAFRLPPYEAFNSLPFRTRAELDLYRSFRDRPAE
jgi:GntR family transcriptional regulator, transcriptional repressor for pyruvate dehydrogenase complex